MNVNASRGWPFGCLVDLVWVLLSSSWLFLFGVGVGDTLDDLSCVREREVVHGGSRRNS